jgi:uncharacterized membrane protein
VGRPYRGDTPRFLEQGRATAYDAAGLEPWGLCVQIFEDFFDANGGLAFLSRYGHVLFGVAWIGLLYFFNFVQVPSFAEMSADARSEALRKVTSRALWWFRWAAMATLVTGLMMWGLNEYFTDSVGNSARTAISWGSILGITMAANVWMVIWPNQRINIASAEAVANGGQADPRQPAAAKAAARASRANTLFSIPMLFFMVFVSHWSFRYGNDAGPHLVAWIIFLVLWVFVQANALGYLPGKLDSAFNVAVFDDHRKTIYAGIAFWLILLILTYAIIIGS